MSTQTKKRPKKEAKAPGKRAEREDVKVQETPAIEEDDRGLNFGGLPARDLKKNLGGCG